MSSKRAIRWMVVCLSLFLIGGVYAQPWPWPASASGDVHEIFQNYGKYQDFFSNPLLVSPYNPNPYCHDALDIGLDDGDTICVVVGAGIVELMASGNGSKKDDMRMDVANRWSSSCHVSSMQPLERLDRFIRAMCRKERRLPSGIESGKEVVQCILI